VIHVDQPRLDPRHDGSEPSLALDERPVPQILAVDGEHVERDEVRPVAALTVFDAGRSLPRWSFAVGPHQVVRSSSRIVRVSSTAMISDRVIVFCCFLAKRRPTEQVS